MAGRFVLHILFVPASLPGLDPESRAPVPCGANQTAKEQQPCQGPASCKLACWRSFGGRSNRVRVGKGSGDVSETPDRSISSTRSPSPPVCWVCRGVLRPGKNRRHTV